MNFYFSRSLNADLDPPYWHEAKQITPGFEIWSYLVITYPIKELKILFCLFSLKESWLHRCGDVDHQTPLVRIWANGGAV